MRQGHVHAETRHQHDEPLRHGKRLGVARRVGPTDGDFEAAQIAAAPLPDGHQVRYGLAGMVHIALHVDHRRVRPFGDFAHIGVAFAGHQIVTNGDGVAVAGENDAGILGALAVRHLHDVGGEKMGVAAELGHAGFKRIPRARGLVEEHQEDGLVGQVAVRHAALELAFEIGRHVQQDVEFRVGPFLGGDPVSSLEEGFHCVFS